ncbi:MAG TPA: HAMP domain-containing sensor histidine kinase [Gemmatimonadales bacterium]|nr:HAMP domain-containing sensor histidine kinase [Gemmatimonadales bacterium]
MTHSRLRLALAARFGAAFLVCLVALDALLYVYIHGQDDRRLTRQITTTSAAVLAGIRRQALETQVPVPVAIDNALRRWPVGPDWFAFFDEQRHLLGFRAHGREVEVVTAPWPHPDAPIWEVDRGPDATFRLTEASDTVLGMRLSVVVARSTVDLRQHEKALLNWLLASIPIVILFAVAAGYFVGAGSLAPIARMTRAIAAMDPGDLDRRLPVREPQDELDSLADQFNRLLARLAQAQQQNRLFLAQAAHQLKTPLMIVRGESTLSLERPRDPQEYEASLRRVQRASEQMAQRVDGLFLLAHAQAGERPPMNDAVELDGLALECADLLRKRAQALHQTLQLDAMDPVHARANEILLREALLELVENGLRHGSPTLPVSISVHRENGMAHLEVSSAGPLIAPESRDAHGVRSSGLGLSIVRWIAAAHNGSLLSFRRDERNVFALILPAVDLPEHE